MPKIRDIQGGTWTPRVYPPRHLETEEGVLDGDILYLVNSRTGAAIESWVYDSRAKPADDDWIRIYQSMAWELAKTPLKSVVSYRVLMTVLAGAGFGNGVRINLAGLAREWDCSVRTMTRSVDELIGVNLIERAKVQGHYRLNPNFAWKGTEKRRPGQLKRWAEKHMPTPAIKTKTQEQG